MKNKFVIRTTTGVLFVALLVFCILYSPLTFAVIFAIISAFAVGEFVHLVNQIENVSINKIINMVGGVYLFFAFLGFCMNISDSKIFIPYLLLLIYLLISELYLKKENPINNWAYSMLSQIYIALPFALLSILAFQVNKIGAVEYNPILPLSVFIFLWVNDSGAYCIGCLFGKHRLFERISPKKSWEGSIGGGVFAIATAFVLAHFFPFISLLTWIGMALVVVIF